MFHSLRVSIFLVEDWECVQITYVSYGFNRPLHYKDASRTSIREDKLHADQTFHNWNMLLCNDMFIIVINMRSSSVTVTFPPNMCSIIENKEYGFDATLMLIGFNMHRPGCLFSCLRSFPNWLTFKLNLIAVVQQVTIYNLSWQAELKNVHEPKLIFKKMCANINVPLFRWQVGVCCHWRLGLHPQSSFFCKFWLGQFYGQMMAFWVILAPFLALYTFQIAKFRQFYWNLTKRLFLNTV
jgi:hypothetical protein